MQENAIDVNRLYKSHNGLDVHTGDNLNEKSWAYISLMINAVGREAENTGPPLIFYQAGRSNLQLFDAEHRLIATQRQPALPEHRLSPRSRRTAGSGFICRWVMDTEDDRQSAA